NLLPGMTAVVTVGFKRADVLGDRILVPLSAVTKNAAGEQIVWILAEEKVTARVVKLGEATGNELEVVGGLTAGDRVAVAGATMLREGMKVRDLGNALGGETP
ncbi:efflux RND transporter periplasmic adaptor subunit, partial [bacterium]|nr:efflux RND transporter periplasmic adaptor subunit [bacterium]